MKNIQIGIYCIENKVNNKKYIGQSIDIDRRINHHINNSKKDKRSHGENKILWEALKEYGIDNFDIYILKKCKKEKLDELETYYIEKLKSHCSQSGYNLTFGGGNNAGYKHDKSTVEKIVEALSKRIISEETREKLRISKLGKNNPNYGKPLSQETKDKMANSSSGEKNWRFGKKNDDNTSKYFGVNLLDQGKYKYWTVYITIQGNRIYLGSSKDEIKAAQKYDDYIIKNNLPNPLNFPISK